MKINKDIGIFITAILMIAGIIASSIYINAHLKRINLESQGDCQNEAGYNEKENESFQDEEETTDNKTGFENETDKESQTEKKPEWSMEVCGKTVTNIDEFLDVSNTEITDIDKFVSQLQELPALRKVDMCNCGLTNEQMEQLSLQLPGIKLVWEIKMGIWTLRTDAVAFSTLKDGTIMYNLTDEDAKLLKYCTDMVALDIGHNHVTDLSFLQYMPNLKILILVDNMTEDGTGRFVYDLSMLKYCKKLMYLEFFVGSVSDISVLGDLKELVDLNISYNPISDITPLLNLPKLERLFLEHTNVSLEDYALLQETYPDAQIVYYGTGSVDQGWRTHERYYAMKDMYRKNYVHELFK